MLVPSDALISFEDTIRCFGQVPGQPGAFRFAASSAVQLQRLGWTLCGKPRTYAHFRPPPGSAHRGRDPVKVEILVPNDVAIRELAAEFHREGVAQWVVNADLLLAASYTPVGTLAYTRRTIDPFNRDSISEPREVVHHEHASVRFWVLGASWLARAVWSLGANEPPVVKTSESRGKPSRREEQLDLALGSEMAPDDEEFSEGEISLGVHLERERNREVVEQAKRLALEKNGKLVCEVCGFDFNARYGKRGGGYIEAHHRVPLSTLTSTTIVRVQDLAMVCANCHRMLHRGKPWPTVDGLRVELKQRGDQSKTP